LTDTADQHLQLHRSVANGAVWHDRRANRGQLLLQLWCGGLDHYGIITTPPACRVHTTATSTFTPPSAWPTNPTLNTPYTKTFTVTTDTSVFGQTASASSTQTETRTYSTEQITTLVGSFAACKVKYDVTANGTTTTSFSWTVGSGRLKGHLLKSSTGAGVRTLEATVLLVNGS
jgi:hypothetical protein